jgi:hypothetical protein
MSGALLRGGGGSAGGGGAGGAGGGSGSSKAGVNANGASGAADGVLSITPDSPADSEWRARRGPLDVEVACGGPWGEEDAAGAWRVCTVAHSCASNGERGGMHVGFFNESFCHASFCSLSSQI